MVRDRAMLAVRSGEREGRGLYLRRPSRDDHSPINRGVSLSSGYGGFQRQSAFWFPTDESEGEAIGTAQATALGRPKKTFRVLISLKGSLFDCRAKKSYAVSSHNHK